MSSRAIDTHTIITTEIDLDCSNCINDNFITDWSHDLQVKLSELDRIIFNVFREQINY